MLARLGRARGTRATVTPGGEGMDAVVRVGYVSGVLRLRWEVRDESLLVGWWVGGTRGRVECFEMTAQCLCLVVAEFMVEESGSNV